MPRPQQAPMAQQPAATICPIGPGAAAKAALDETKRLMAASFAIFNMCRFLKNFSENLGLCSTLSRRGRFGTGLQPVKFGNRTSNRQCAYAFMFTKLCRGRLNHQTAGCASGICHQTGTAVSIVAIRRASNVFNRRAMSCHDRQFVAGRKCWRD